MKWPPTNLREALSPLIILSNFMGLAVIECPLGKSRPVITFFYVFFFCHFYGFLFKFGPAYLNINVFSKPEISGDLEGIQKVLLAALTYINISIAASSIIICWYKNKDLKLVIRRLNSMEESLKYLGYEKDYRKLFLQTLLRVLVWFLATCFLILIDIFWLYEILSPYQLLYCSYIFHTPLQLNAVIDMSFIISVENLISKLKIVNALLLEASETCSSLKIACYEARKTAGFKKPINEGLISIEKKTLIRILRNLHLEINNLSQNLNTIYGMQISMEMTAYLALITGFLYNLYFITITRMEMYNKIKSFVRIAVWCSVYIVRFLRVNYVGANITDEARKTGQVLIKLDVSTRDIEIRTEMKLFLLQLLQRPIYFTTCGSATLDYTFVRRFIGSVTTYLVILIQMHPNPGNSEN